MYEYPPGNAKLKLRILFWSSFLVDLGWLLGMRKTKRKRYISYVHTHTVGYNYPKNKSRESS